MSDKLVPLSRVIEILDGLPDKIVGGPQEITSLVIDELIALADTTPDIAAERDALAERVDALHKALRGVAIAAALAPPSRHLMRYRCVACNSLSWADGEGEFHAIDCLASPSTPPTDGAV